MPLGWLEKWLSSCVDVSMSATIAGMVSPELLLPRFFNIIHC